MPPPLSDASAPWAARTTSFVRSLDGAAPGRPGVTLIAPSENVLLPGCTCYFRYDGLRANPGDPSTVVRLTLQAQLDKSRADLGAAFVLPGQQGIAFVVTGVFADSFIVLAQGLNSRSTLTLGIASTWQGSNSLAVVVPPGLAVPPTGTPPALTQRPANPLQQPRLGIVRVRTEENEPGGSLPLVDGERVVGIVAEAGADWTLATTSRDGVSASTLIPGGQLLDLSPTGLVGPGLVELGADSYRVETVR